MLASGRAIGLGKGDVEVGERLIKVWDVHVGKQGRQAPHGSQRCI